MANSDDHRKFPRLKVVLPIAVASGKNQRLDLADIEDLTVEGISFLSETPIPEGSDVYVLFPSGKDMGENEIPGEVIRSQPLKGSSQHRIAVRFIEMNDAFLMDVLALIHKELPRFKKKLE